MALINVGDSQTFNYTGGIQSLTISVDGIYKLDVYGGQGGAGGNGHSGSKGGYSSGYSVRFVGETLYAVAGGAGVSSTGTAAGGYNGGGTSIGSGDTCGSGGGASHIALASGELKTLSQGSLLVVAGGAGGSVQNSNDGYNIGGFGGGTTGGSIGSALGGTQTTGYAFGQGQSAVAKGGSYYSAGGGGGLYGGTAQWDGAAGGGSGYIGGCPIFHHKGVTYEPSMIDGFNSGNGKVVITLVALYDPVEIITAVTPGGSGTATGAGFYRKDEDITLVATPAPTYVFKYWSTTDSEGKHILSTNATYTFKAVDDMIIVANFLPTYDIVVQADPATAGAVTGGGNYEEGELVTIVASPNAGQSLLYWTKDGVEVSKNLFYTFPATENATYIAHFNESVVLKTHVFSGQGTTYGDGTYAKGAKVKVKAIPHNTNKFNDWYLHGYTQLDYIEATGTQWIDTGLLFNDTSWYPIEIDFRCSVPSSSGANYCIAGCGNSNWNGPVMLNFYNNYMEWGTSGYSGAGSYTPNTIYNYKYYTTNGSQKCYQNGTLFHSNTRSWATTTKNLHLFHFNYGSYNGAFKGKMYNFKISCAGKLLRDYIPVVRWEDGAIGLYDLVEDKFYGNAGTGEFIMGGVK